MKITHSLPDRVLLAGIIDPGIEEPGFAAPAFIDRDGTLYLSNTAENRVSISSFSRVDAKKSDLIPAPAGLPKDYSVGDANIFMFRDTNGSFHAGTRPQLSKQLRRRFSGLSRHPFCQLEVAGFIDSGRLLALAIRRSLLIEAEAHNGSARQALDEMMNSFGLDEDIAKSLFALDFSHALLSYYRIFHRLIHVQNHSIKRRLTYRFRLATDNIVPFLIDRSLFEIILGATWKQYQPSLPSIDFETTPKEYQIETVLRRLGVSASQARRYATRALREPSRPSIAPTAKQAIAACNSIRALHFRNRYAEFAINRIDKKKRKKELDSEFIDLVFGLALTLSHELRALELDSDEFTGVRAALSSSIQRFAASHDDGSQ